MSEPKLVFAYGTLTITEILVALLGKMPQSQWVTLHDYRRCRFDPEFSREAKGPAAIPAPGEELRGLLLELDDREWEIIEKFESSAGGYEHNDNCKAVLDDGQSVAMVFYEAGPTIVHKLKGVWDAEEFRQKWLAMYLEERIPAFMDKHGFA